MQPVMMQPCDEKVMLDAKATIALKLVGTHRFEIQVWLVEIDLKFNFGIVKIACTCCMLSTLDEVTGRLDCNIDYIH